LIKQARERLAAVALGLVMWAIVEAIDLCAVRLEMALQLGVDRVDIGGGVKTAGDAALVGDDDDPQSSMIQPRDGFGDAGEQAEFVRGSDVTAFRHFLVEDAVAVEEDRVQDAAHSAVTGSDHSIMIATYGHAQALRGGRRPNQSERGWHNLWAQRSQG